ncbi:peptidoglycan-binding domain-containing protein [Roseomonas populi]|uniref:Peptidoglycan-binding protein n=1 Tax=Roseomonas populi TaxID=3121582 RepID=A0ABT1XAX9_9PROT|nr:peptidoglycan-binding domain-containing protein [Roseomonas pecuniae]MCR0984287.1 peptidoglycan-binding protein [Roseomonas pecuniae]
MTSPPRLLPAAALVALAAACSSALAQGPAQTSSTQAPPGNPATCDPRPAPGSIAAALCADPAARTADRRRAQAYEALRHQLHPAQRPGLEADAGAFLAFLETQCRPAGTPDAACIARAAAAKRDDLIRWLQPPAREEAERAPEAQAELESRLPPDPETRREAIAALQRAAGLPATGFLDSRTAALVPTRPNTPAAPTASAPAPAVASLPLPPPQAPAITPADTPTAPPAGTVWLPRFPAALNARYALTECGAPTLTWFGGGLYIGNRPVPGETDYAIFADEQRFYLFPPAGGPARIVEGQPDGSMRLSGAIPAALVGRGVSPGTVLRRCADQPIRIEVARPARRR